MVILKPKKTKPPGRSESSILSGVLRYSETIPEINIWRMNAGAAKLRGFWVFFGRKGQGDLGGIIKGGIRLEVEVKRPGEKQSKDQRDYQTMIEKFDGIYLVVTSESEFMEKITTILRAMGLRH